MAALSTMSSDGGGGAGGIETALKGDPGALHRAAAWAATTHAQAIDTAADNCATARGHAASGWSGTASDGFIEQMGRYVKDADEVAAASRTAGRSLGDYASGLETAQNRLAAIRAQAQADGLTVSGTMIMEPDAGPPRPTNPPQGAAATPGAVSSYNASVVQYNAAQAKISAYNSAALQVNDVMLSHQVAVINLGDDLAKLWRFVQEHNGPMNAGDNTFTTVATALTAGWAKFAKGDAARASQNLVNDAERAIASVTKDPAGYGAAEGNRILNEAGRLKLDAGDMRAVGEDAEHLGGARGIKLGAGFAVVGTVLDVANGERVDQAAVSNAVGFGAAYTVGLAADAAAGAGATILASTAAGAAMGSAVPIVGTVVGAVAGAVVGTFATGAVASLWDDHPSLGHAWDRGVETVEDTGKTIVDVAGSAGSAIGDGAKSVWHSIFG